IEVNPDYFQAYLNLGILLAEKERLDDSIACFEKVINLNPDYAEGYYNLGNSYRSKDSLLYLNHTGDVYLHKAKECYRKTIELMPDFAEAYNNLAIILNIDGEKEEAIAYFKKSIELKPDYKDAYINLGDMYRYQNNPIKAIECCKKVLEIDPDEPDANCNMGLAYFMLKDLDNGWKCMEYRDKTKEKIWMNIPKFSQPRLKSLESVKDKTIYVYYEQGLGDAIQFVRYLPLLSNAGAKIIYKPQSGLEQLFKQSDLKAEIIDNSTPDDSVQFDMFVPLMSLPYLFKTNLDNVPCSSGYLKADPEKVREYQEKYFKCNELKIGINWHCRNTFRADTNRSISDISSFFDIARLDKVKLYSLQKGDGAEQLNNLDIEIVDLGKTFNDFSDTAAAIENLDLVISVDTSVAHLAGSLGKPAWILLQYSPDWRWFLDTETTIWYDSVRLFRQQKPGNWDEVMDRVYNELCNR
ncbi:MAG TPA: hypothetical protein DDX14_04345, partial [Cyanobacteria bacterium UBA9579]|nr:hypothetical protein [Cyanobacteria bacterium UBA9579]